MRYRLTFMLGLAAGYVLGSRAGRERYEQLRKAAQQVSQNPAVRNTTESVVLTGREFASKAASVVSDRMGDDLPRAIADRVRSLRNRNGDEDDWGRSNT